MPAVFVHGVPDTGSEWDAVRGFLTRADVVAPNLPGFGTPLPAGFEATKEEYVDWLTDEIRSIGVPVVYVGPEFGERLAKRTNARLEMYPDSGHWWPITKAQEVATALEELWSTPELA